MTPGPTPPQRFTKCWTSDEHPRCGVARVVRVRLFLLFFVFGFTVVVRCLPGIKGADASFWTRARGTCCCLLLSNDSFPDLMYRLPFSYSRCARLRFRWMQQSSWSRISVISRHDCCAALFRNQCSLARLRLANAHFLKQPPTCLRFSSPVWMQRDPKIRQATGGPMAKKKHGGRRRQPVCRVYYQDAGRCVCR